MRFDRHCSLALVVALMTHCVKAGTEQTE